MVTGIEVAGLVLGAFPLAIEAIKAYASGIQTMKDIIKYKEGLDWFELRLSIEHFHFQETMVGLLEEDYSPDDIQRLVSDPGGGLWKATHVQASLQRWIRGRGEGVKLFLQIVERLHRTLREVTAKFAKPTGTGSVSNRYRLAVLAWNIGMLSEYMEETIDRLRKLNAELRLFISPQNSNSMMNDTLENISPIVCKKAIQQYNRIQTHAKSAYGLLDEYLQPPLCRCPAPHHASLQLEMRVNEDLGFSKFQVSGGDSQALLNIIFSVDDVRERPSACRELLLEGLESQTDSEPPKQSAEPGELEDVPGSKAKAPVGIGSQIKASAKKLVTGFSKQKPQNRQFAMITTPVPRPTSTKKSKKLVTFAPQDTAGYRQQESPHGLTGLGCNINASKTGDGSLKKLDNLCNAIRSEADQHHCLGILSSNTSNIIQTRVWIPKPSPLRIGPVEVVSLESLLTSYHLPKPTLKSRMTVAVKLASSVMQLHSTAWLNDFWSTSDIWFPRRTSTDNMLERPLICKAFSHITKPPLPADNFPTHSELWRVLDPNEYLLSLGIILIELLEWRNFDSLRKDKSYNLLLKSSGDEKIDRYLAAKQLVDYLRDQYRDNDLYFTALRRCIQGLDHGEKTLASDGYKKEVYKVIVRPLEVHLRQGWGC